MSRTTDKTDTFDFDAAHATVVAMRDFIKSQVKDGPRSSDRGFHMMISFTESGEVRYSVRRGYERTGEIDGASHPGDLIAELLRRIEWAEAQRVKGLPQIGRATA